MKRILIILLIIVMVITLSGCSKTGRFSIRAELYTKNNDLTILYEDILERNDHSLSTEVAYDNFITVLKISPNGFYVDGLSYYINTGITNQEYQYTGYICEQNDSNNKLSCYTRKDDAYNKDYYIEHISFSTVLDTINENEIMNVLDDLQETYSVVFNQDVRILISVKHFDNETFDFDSINSIYYDESGVMHSEGELLLNEYYLHYTYLLDGAQNNIYNAYVKIN